MKNIKIVFFDIDGTLLKLEAKQMTEKTLETLHKLQEKGIKICIATGRTPVSLPKFEGIEFDAYLTFNGSYCYTKDGEDIFSNPIPHVDVEILLRNAKSMDRHVSVAIKSRLAANGSDADLEEYYAFAHIPLEVADDFDEVVNEEVYQIMLACREEEYADMLKDVKGARITAWWDKAVDIIPSNGGKGIGIEKMLEYYGFDRLEALAFGDGSNDIEMLQTVGTGVAMGNAKDNVKAIADEVCGDVADDGIYHYCVEKGVI